MVAGPQGAGDVQFLPPGGSFPGNYRVSVQVEFGSLTDGCVSIYTRSSAAATTPPTSATARQLARKTTNGACSG